jgi:crotonobetainyl-CoA:carnitine CoA-transferase CaiB-like acyl-CoA transferase
MLAVGTDAQFHKLCDVMLIPRLAVDPRFLTNALRVEHRDALVPQLEAAFAKRPVAEWIEKLTGVGVPCGPFHNIPQVFEDEHVKSRGVKVSIPHPRAGSVPALANPARLSATPPAYDKAAPALGEHTREVLTSVLGLFAEEIDQLAADGVI